MVPNSPKDLIITLPHQSLRQRSKKVGYIDDSIVHLINKMELATLDWEDSRDHEVGVALAAVQINNLSRVIIIREDFGDKHNRHFTILINPEIVKTDGKLIEDFEGCLSIKDIYGKVPGYEKVKIKALDTQGREVRVTAEGFLARVIQHEIDHTNGIVFIDHIKDNPEAFYKLEDDGKLKKLDYDKEIASNSILW